MSFLTGKAILITGGTGSFGKAAVQQILKHGPEKLIVYSRDELKQHEMRQTFNQECMRYLIGDVRDLDRLIRAMSEVNYVIHAAAMKQVPTCEYNPIEAIRTNIEGSKNVVLAAHEIGIHAAVLLSSDKACAPLNLYGATKMVAEKLFVHGHVYSSTDFPRLCVVRYGNVIASRGSVIPIFRRQARAGLLKITDRHMTRFWMTLPQAVRFVIHALESTEGREIYVPKLPAMKITDLAEAIAPGVAQEFTGIRPGEKLHELLIAPGEAYRTIEREDSFRIYRDGDRRLISEQEYLTTREQYGSDDPYRWLSSEELREMI
jgi:UDP-N-acetylglucosamine 4,6-dehydratase